MFNRPFGAWVAIIMVIVWFFGGMMWLTRAPQAKTGAFAITPTPTLCPMPTPEWLWVDPVTSPTEMDRQTITVGIGNGDAVTVTTPFESFAITGTFDPYNHPAKVPIDLMPNESHPLTVSAHVREVYVGGCPYGNYTLTTTMDRNGQPLVIQQITNYQMALPIVIR